MCAGGILGVMSVVDVRERGRCRRGRWRGRFFFDFLLLLFFIIFIILLIFVIALFVHFESDALHQVRCEDKHT